MTQLAKLSDYQKKVYNKILHGIPLYQSQMGYHTPAAKFLNDHMSGINANTLNVLEKSGLIKTTDIRFGGSFTTTRYYHIHNDKPWLRVPTNWGTPKIQ